MTSFKAEAEWMAEQLIKENIDLINDYFML